MADLAEILESTSLAPVQRRETALHLLPSPAPLEPEAAADPQDRTALAEVEYAPMYYI